MAVIGLGLSRADANDLTWAEYVRLISCHAEMHSLPDDAGKPGLGGGMTPEELAEYARESHDADN